MWPLPSLMAPPAKVKATVPGIMQSDEVIA
jgi:hypothetical protein